MEVDERMIISSSSAGADAATSAILPPLTSLLPSATNPPKRADLLSLKSRLAALLPPQSGHVYWTALVGFLAGKINRDELGTVIKRVLGVEGEGVQLHNALLLSILYNTTRTAPPPASVRHAGWHKRQRDKDGNKLQDRDPQRRKVKATVMALGKRERADIKALALVRHPRGLDVIPRGPEDEESSGKTYLSKTLDSRECKLNSAGIPVGLDTLAVPEETLRQDYLRCLQALNCTESKLLPTPDSLRDRMTLIAYESNLSGGADHDVASLGVMAVQAHLKSMISSVINLLRSNRVAGIPTTRQSQLNLLATLSDVAPSLDGPFQAPSEVDVASLPPTEGFNNSVTPLSLADFSSLFDIAPHLLVQPHVAAVEKLYAIPSSSEDEGSSEGSISEPESDLDEPAPVPSPLAPAAPTRAPLPRHNTGRSRANSTVIAPNATATGRDKYLLDPASVPIPLGHPDIVYHHPQAKGNEGSGGLSERRNAGGSGSLHVSPQASRDHLYPDATDEATMNSAADKDAAAKQRARSPSNNTSTDGEESDDAATAAAGGQSHPAIGMGRGSRGGPAGRGGRSGGRKGERGNWEVVDSVRLLDGILD